MDTISPLLKFPVFYTIFRGMCRESDQYSVYVACRLDT